jgi:hypothetical protein
MKRFLLCAVALFFASPVFAADLSITAANVKAAGSSSKPVRVKFGEAVTQGQAVYLKASDGEYYKADADAGTSEIAGAVGVAITPASTDEYGYILTEGPVTIGATMTVGEIYVLSGTAGGICPEADLATADRVTIIGVATSTTVLAIQPFASTAIVP